MAEEELTEEQKQAKIKEFEESGGFKYEKPGWLASSSDSTATTAALDQTQGSIDAGEDAFRAAYKSSLEEQGFKSQEDFASVGGVPESDEQAYQQFQDAKQETKDALAIAGLVGVTETDIAFALAEGEASGQANTPAENSTETEEISSVKTPPTKPGSRTGDHLLDVIKKNKVDTFVSDSVVFQLKNGQLVNSIRTIEDLEQYVFQRISLRDLIILTLSCAENKFDIDLLAWLDAFLKMLGGLRIPKFAINIPRLSFKDLMASYSANLETAMRKAIEAMIVEYIKKLLVAIASCDFKAMAGAMADPFNDIGNFFKDPGAGFKDLGNKLLDFTRNEAGKAGLGNVFATVEEGVTTIVAPSKSKYMANQTSVSADALGKLFGAELDKSLTLKQKRDLFLGLSPDNLLEDIRDKISKRFDVPKDKIKNIDSLRSGFRDLAANVDLVAMENKIILDGEQQIVSEDTCATFKDKLRRRYTNSEDFPDGVPEDIIDQIIDSLPDDISIDPNAPNSIMDMPTEFDLDECELGVENPVSDQIMSSVLSSIFGSIKMFFDAEVAAFPIYLSGQDAPPPVPPMMPEGSPGEFNIGKGDNDTPYPTPDIHSIVTAASKIHTILPDLKRSLVWNYNDDTIITNIDYTPGAAHSLNFTLRNKFKNLESFLSVAGSMGDLSTKVQQLSTSATDEEIGSIFAGGSTTYLSDLTAVLEENPWFDGARYTIHETKDPYKVTGLQKLAPDANPSKIHEVRLYHELFGVTGSTQEALTSVFPMLVGSAVTKKNSMKKEVRGEYLELPEEPILSFGQYGTLAAAIPNSVWWSQLVTKAWSDAAYTESKVVGGLEVLETKEAQLEKFEGFKIHMAHQYPLMVENIFRRYLHGCSFSKYFKPEEILGSSFAKNPFCEPAAGEKDILGISSIVSEVTTLMKKLECEGDLDAFKKATCSGLVRLYVRTLVMDWVLPSIFAFSQYGAAIANGDTLYPLVFKLLEKHLNEMSSAAPGPFVRTIKLYADLTIFEWGGAERQEDHDDIAGLKILIKEELKNVSQHFQENGIIDVNSGKGLIEQFIHTIYNDGWGFQRDGSVSDYPSYSDDDPLYSYNTYPVLKDVPAIVELSASTPGDASYPTMDYTHGNGLIVTKEGGLDYPSYLFFNHGSFLMEKFVIADLKPIEELPDAPVVKISDNGDLLNKSKLIISDTSDYFKDIIFDSTPRGEHKVPHFLKGHSNLTKFSEITNVQSNWVSVNAQLEEVDKKIHSILQEIVHRSQTQNQFIAPTITVWEGTNDYGQGPEPMPSPNEYFKVGLGGVDSKSPLYMPGTTGELPSLWENNTSRNDRLVFTIVGKTVRPSGENSKYSFHPDGHLQNIDEFCVWIDAQELAEHANAIMNNRYYFGTPDTWSSDLKDVKYESTTIHAVQKDEYGDLIKSLPWGSNTKLDFQGLGDVLQQNTLVSNPDMSNTFVWIPKTITAASEVPEASAWAKGIMYEEIDYTDPNEIKEVEQKIEEQLQSRLKSYLKYYVRTQENHTLTPNEEQDIVEAIENLHFPMPSIGSPAEDFEYILFGGEQVEAPEGFFDLVTMNNSTSATQLIHNLNFANQATIAEHWSFLVKAFASGKSLQDLFPSATVFNNTPDPEVTKKRFKIYTVGGQNETTFPIGAREKTIVFDPPAWSGDEEFVYEDYASYFEQAVIGATLVFYNLKMFCELQDISISDAADNAARKLSIPMQSWWGTKRKTLLVTDRDALGYRALVGGFHVSALSEKYDLKYPIVPKIAQPNDYRFWGYGNFREKQAQVEDFLINLRYYRHLVEHYDTFQGTGADSVLLFLSEDMDIAGLGKPDTPPTQGKRWIRQARTQPNFIGTPGSVDHGVFTPDGANGHYASEPGGYKPLSLYGFGIVDDQAINNKKMNGKETNSYKALNKWLNALQQFAIERRQLLEQAEDLLSYDTYIAEEGATWPAIPLNDFFVNPPELGIRLSYVMPVKDFNSFSEAPTQIVEHLSYLTQDLAQDHPSVKEKTYLIREPVSEDNSSISDNDTIRIPLITKTMPLAEAIGSAGVVSPEISFNLQKDNPGWLTSLNNNKGEYGALEILKKKMIEAPDTKLLLEEIIPLENINTALYAYITNSVYFYTNNKTLSMFSTSRAMLIDQLAAVNSADFGTLKSAENFDLASAMASATSDPKNAEGIDAMLILQCTLQIYKSLVESFDPAVATAKAIKDIVADVYSGAMRLAHNLAFPDEKWCPDPFAKMLRSSRLVPGYVLALQPFPLGMNTLTPINPFFSLPYLGLALIGLDPKDKSIINLQNLSGGLCKDGEEDKQCK